MKDKLVAVLLVVPLLLGVGWILWSESPGTDEARDATAVSGEVVTSVKLTPEQATIAQIQRVRIEERTLQPTRLLPARLQYDLEKHVALQPACSGILMEVMVRPGDQVTRGQPLATIRSPEVAAARIAVRQSLVQLEIASQERLWHQAVCDGVERLVALIKSGATPDEIERQLVAQSLGEYREKLIAAYTRSRLAGQSATTSREAADQGAVATRVQQARETERQSAKAAVDAIAEQSIYEVDLICRQAAAKLSQAERQLANDQSELSLLLGPTAEEFSNAKIKELGDESLSLVTLVSPMDGSVERRLQAVSERVQPQSEILTIADTSRLWVVADVRQNEWNVMQSSVGDAAQVFVMGASPEPYSAEIIQLGRELDPLTGSTQLICRLQEKTPLLRPGLFARLQISVGQSVTGVAVPESAVVVHEGTSFVFVTQSPLEFRRQDVTTGITANGWTHIVSGLEPGTEVAVAGVFVLKSELLLAGEE